MAVNQGTISQQAYDYNIPPKNDVPFWGDEDINDNLTATATVDDTTGTPSVSVTKQNWNLDFAFKGIKGETGPQGEKGDPGESGKSVKVTSTGSDVSGAVAGSVIDGDGKYITIYNGQQGAKGEQGERGPQGAPGIPGSDADVSKCVTGVSLTNENGIYGISETKGDGTTTDVGSIEVPNIDNTLAEVNDEIVENTAQGYDYHTIKETEHNGTVNNVGSFYLAKKQITSLDSKGNFTMVDQSGNESTGQLEIGGGINESYNLNLQQINFTERSFDTDALYQATISFTVAPNGEKNGTNFSFQVLFRTGLSNEIVTKISDRNDLDATIGYCFVRLIVNGVSNSAFYTNAWLNCDASKCTEAKVSGTPSVSFIKVL